MIMINNSENKAFRYISKQLAQINDINTYHGKDNIERSVSSINSLKKCAQELIDNGANETSVNKWLDEMLDCFKEGFTYEEITKYWRTKFNEVKADAQKALMTRALFLQKLSMEEKDTAKSLSISKDCTYLLKAVVYLSDNINYNA